MPEGHLIHRTAAIHNKQLVGYRTATTSPQGRFADEAELLRGRKLQRVEAHGKHLFYHWRGKVVHVHLGLYGKFRPLKKPFTEPRGAVRLRMTANGHGFDLVGPNRCEILGAAEVKKILGRLGQDPLRDDADPEIAWNRISKSRAAIGRLLLDQSVIAGVGNIYRADALFDAGIHPDRAGNSLVRDDFDTLWSFLDRTMHVGKKYNKIINVLPADVGKPYSKMKREERLLVYKKEHCVRCDTRIKTWDCGSRTVYACLKCQN